MEEWNVVVTIFRSAGNESVGEMWRETKILSCNDDIKKIFDWVSERTNQNSRKTRIEITVAQ